MRSKTIQVDKTIIDALEVAIEEMLESLDIQSDYKVKNAVSRLKFLKADIEQAFKQTDMIFTEGVQSKWNQKCLRKKWTKQLWRF